jgi:hypothetical protein
MWGNPVLFEALGVSWTAAKCLFIGAGLSAILGAIGFVWYGRHIGVRAQPLGSDEAAMVASFPAQGTDIVVPIAMGPARGVSYGFSWNINTFRDAARRGDRVGFWLLPTTITFWCLAFQFLFTGIGCLITEPGKGLIATLACGAFIALMLFINWFMPWAALHTKIDLPQSAAPAPSAPRR